MGKNLPNANTLKYTQINADGYSLDRREGCQHQLHERYANV